MKVKELLNRVRVNLNFATASGVSIGALAMNTPNDPSNPNRPQTAEDLKAKAGQASQDVKAQAQQASQEAKTKARQEFEKQESRAADTMNKVSDATHAAADELAQGNETTLSHYVSEIADGIGKMSNNLQHKNTDELIQEASRLARENTGLFLLGSVALGFGISRIAKASRPAGDGDASHWEDYGQQESRSYSAGASASPSPSPSRSPGGPSSGSSSSPTHASTSYLPGEGASTQNPTPDSGSPSSPANNPGGTTSR